MPDPDFERAANESDSPAESQESLLSLADDESFRSDIWSSISHMCRNKCTVGRDTVVTSASNSVHWTADICSTASVQKILNGLEDNIQRLLVFCGCVCGNRTLVRTYSSDKTTRKIQKRDIFTRYQRRFAAAAASSPSKVDFETSPSEQYSVYLRIRNQEEPPKFSQPYDPRTSTASSGFIPVKGPPIRAIENSRTLGRTKQWSSREAKSSVTLPRSESIQERHSSARVDDGESNLPWWSAERFSSKRLRGVRDGADTSGSVKTKERSPPKRSRSRRKRIKQRESSEGVIKSPGRSTKAFGEKLTDVSKDDDYQFSSIYDPKRNTSSSGFIPIPAPHRPAKTVKTNNNPSRLVPKTVPKPKKEEKPSKIVRKESYGNEELLGDGNFEIITGGLFLDPDDNEIVRQFGLKSYKRKKFRKFVPSRDFHYPKYFWGDSPSEHAMTLPMSYDMF